MKCVVISKSNCENIFLMSVTLILRGGGMRFICLFIYLFLQIECTHTSIFLVKIVHTYVKSKQKKKSDCFLFIYQLSSRRSYFGMQTKV